MDRWMKRRTNGWVVNEIKYKLMDDGHDYM